MKTKILDITLNDLNISSHLKFTFTVIYNYHPYFIDEN